MPKKKENLHNEKKNLQKKNYSRLHFKLLATLEL